MSVILGHKDNNTDFHIDWDEVLKGEPNADSKLHHSSFPLQVDLPSIVAENGTSCPDGLSGAVHRNMPFRVSPPNMSAIVWCASPAATVSNNYHIYCMSCTLSKNKRDQKLWYAICDEAGNSTESKCHLIFHSLPVFPPSKLQAAAVCECMLVL
jgi:hypothetical protein